MLTLVDAMTTRRRLKLDLHTGESIGVSEVANIPVYACKIENGAVLVDVDQQLNDATPS